MGRAMKSVLIGLSLLLGVAAGALADELADANKALEGKSYAQAMQLYGKLANAGNPVAQLHLGEMYWYGEGTPADLVQAKSWFTKAAASGNAEAKAALVTMQQREVRKADIAYWSTAYDGADLKTGKFACVRPTIPALSKTNEEIKAVDASVATWRVCYDAFAKNLGDALPPGKRLPADIGALMNEQEYEQTLRHLDQVYTKVGGEELAGAKETMAAHAAWTAATKKYVAEQNDLIKSRAAADAKILAETARNAEHNVVTSGQHAAMPTKH